MRFVPWSEVVERFRGKRVAIVGSGPGVLHNEPGYIDGYDVVVRVNNYSLCAEAGFRAEVHYSFYGSSIRKTAAALRADGVTLCINKCPNAKPIESDWHMRHGKQNGIDFRYIFALRANFWFCDTYVPEVPSFLDKFELLERHIPTTGFAAILDVLDCQPSELYLTGFDFFSSGLHNVNERWKPGDPRDPIGHRPEMEADWLAKNADDYPIVFDKKLRRLLAGRIAA